MKQFKKIIALALALVLSLSLAACASKTETAASTETASTETASETTESKGTITVAASPTPHAEILAQAKPILEAEGWTLEVKEFRTTCSRTTSSKAASLTQTTSSTFLISRTSMKSRARTL